jgi:hypothetical protein
MAMFMAVFGWFRDPWLQGAQANTVQEEEENEEAQNAQVEETIAEELESEEADNAIEAEVEVGEEGAGAPEIADLNQVE